MEDGKIGELEDGRLGGLDDGRVGGWRMGGCEDRGLGGLRKVGSGIRVVSVTHTFSGACARVFDGTRLCIRRWAKTQDNEKTQSE